MVDPEPCRVNEDVDTPPTLELDIRSEPEMIPSPANGNALPPAPPPPP